MKKTLTLAMLLTAVLLTATAQIQPTRADYNLKGKVKKVTSVQRYEGVKDMNFQEDYYFDENGLQRQYRRQGFGSTQVIDYPQSLPKDSIQEVTYDHDGDLVKRLVFSLDSVLRQSIHYIYSAPHKLTVIITYTYSMQGVIVKKRLDYYNSKRQCRMTQELTPEETIILEQTFAYDKHGNVTKKNQTVYDVDGSKSKSVEKRKYTYDKQGNWTEQQYYMSGRVCYRTSRRVVYW